MSLEYVRIPRWLVKHTRSRPYCQRTKAGKRAWKGSCGADDSWRNTALDTDKGSNQSFHLSCFSILKNHQAKKMNSHSQKRIKKWTAHFFKKSTFLVSKATGNKNHAMWWCTTVVQIPIVGKAVFVWGQGGYRNSVLSTQFCCGPTTALKNKVYLQFEILKIIPFSPIKEANIFDL